MAESRPLSLEVAALTHVGLRRHTNQDCVAVDGAVLSDGVVPQRWRRSLAQSCVCLLADGMGGHPAGEVASRMAVEHLAAALLNERPGRERLVAALRETNRLLFDEMERTPDRCGMGTTLAGLVADAQGVTAFNVGDSRIYRIRAHGLEQLSVDHSEPISFGWVLFGLAPSRVLNQCLGGFPDNEDLAPHVLELPVEPGSAFLLCSDGLSDMLSDAAMVECLGADPSRSVQALFDAAMAAGGVDNISIVLARLEAEASRSE